MTKFASIAPKQVSAMSGPELLALFNEAAALVGAPLCKRFASLTSGYTRTVKMLAQAVEHEKAHGSIAADSAIGHPETKESIAAKVKSAPKDMIVKAKAPKGAKVWEKTEDGSCPKCGAEAGDITPAGQEGTAAEHRCLCHHCHLEWDPETGKEYNKPKETEGVRAKAVADSWKDPKVAAARAERTGVEVTGKGIKGTASFDSVRKAFVALGLPLVKHIKFRGDLKAAGTLAFGDYTFKSVPRKD